MTTLDQPTSGATGRMAAFIVYGLYLLSIPSAAAFALVGVIVAYVARADASGLARVHLDNAIRIWWLAFWWAVGLMLVAALAWLFIVTIIGAIIGIPLLGLVGLAGFLVFIWFTVVSGWGLLKLLAGEGV